jgi:hypothetical protein
MHDAGGHAGRRARTPGVQHPDGDDLGVAQSADPAPVPGDGGDLPGDVGAVPVRVRAAVGADAVADEVLAQVAADPSAEVLVRRPDTGVDDRHQQARAVRRSGWEEVRVEGVQRPLVGSVGVRGQRRHRGVDGDGQHTRLLAELGHGFGNLRRCDLSGDHLGAVVGHHDRRHRRRPLGGRRRGLGTRRRGDAGGEQCGESHRGQGGVHAVRGHGGARHASAPRTTRPLLLIDVPERRQQQHSLQRVIPDRKCQELAA